MAMRIRYRRSPTLARSRTPMEAVRDGVMETADDSALFQSWGSITIINPLEKIWNGYSDTRMGASMDSYLNGYNDPRLPVYFQPVTEGDNKGEYRGVANGMPNPQQDDYKAMSAPNVQEESTDSPLRWMMASEVAFLRAEGAMRGWTAEMGGTAEEFYNKGIELSFLERGLSAGRRGQVCRRRDERTDQAFERRFGRQSTKYNASEPWARSPTEMERRRRRTRSSSSGSSRRSGSPCSPTGSEAWSEFRRTGYPLGVPRYAPTILSERQGRYQRAGAPHGLPAVRSTRTTAPAVAGGRRTARRSLTPAARSCGGTRKN